MFKNTKENNDLDNERRDRIFTFLRENKVGILATVGPNHDPHATAIYYFVEPDLTISFITKTKTKKHDNIAHNSHVMLVVYEPTSQAIAQVKGKATKIKDDVKLNKIFADVLQAAWDTSDDGVPPITRLIAGEYAAYTIKPKQVHMAVYARPEIGSHEELFETLDSDELQL